MSKELHNYQYEFVKDRPIGHQWRVGDYEDDMVTDFGTEEEAREYVDAHNRMVEEQKKKGALSFESQGT